MTTRDSVSIVHDFWEQVWNAHDASAVDRFVADDFTIVTGGQTITGRQNFREWVGAFLRTLTHLHLTVLESFQNEDGSRVVSRWLLTGKNNGIFGTQPDQQEVAMTGTAVWAVRADGTLLTNWVERSALEAYQRLTGNDRPGVTDR